MTRGELAATIIGSFTVLLASGLTLLGWYVNRRVAAWTEVQRRLSKVETKADMVDVRGTTGNTVAIDQLRRDIEALEGLHRRDVADLDQRIASSQLSQAQLAERLNAFTWGRRPPAQQSPD